jgi:hypothetical protein
MDILAHSVQDLWQGLQGCYRRFLKTATTCRDCQRPVSTLWDVCPHCGLRDPVHFPISESTIIVSFGSLAFLFWLRLM